MSQYVPPHLRNRSSTVPNTPIVSGPSLPPRNSFSSSTMASLTRSTVPNPSSVASVPPVVSDFPVLAPSKTVNSSPWSNGTKSFADLARNWAAEQKEKEENEKLQARERMTQAQLEKEKEEKERTFYRVSAVDATRLIYGVPLNGKTSQKKNRYEEDEDDLGSTAEDDLSYEDEEEDTREADADWNYRRHQNDLY